MNSAANIPWDRGVWTHPPAVTDRRGEDLLVTAIEGSDAWRRTVHGFIRESEHALVAPLHSGRAVEVEFTANFSQQFDQAGLFVRVSTEHWIKAGVEYADGDPQVGAVVTHGRSDWSLAPVPHWAGRRVLVRASWNHGALTIRAARAGEPLRLVRVLPLDDSLTVTAGPYLCAPSRAGLTVPFHAWRHVEADAALH